MAGDDRRIHHAINLVRNAIFAAGKLTRSGCGIADTDYQAAFDYLVMTWVFMVLRKKGLSEVVINRLSNLYNDNLSIVVVNNIEGKCIKNTRLSLRQGDVPSMFFFAYGIDPLITYLERRLSGIVIYSLPVLGPVLNDSRLRTLPPLEERYRVVSYADDLKPAITTMQEFILVNNASALFEEASGCKLHRDPTSQKCKFLPLGRWRQSLQQEDIPNACQYMVISEHLDMLGVQLKATWTQTKKTNGDMIQKRVSNTINSWKAGKFMPLTMRPWSINSYILSKVWFKCGSVDLRIGDIAAINTSMKSWLFADLLQKPSEMVMCRPTSVGGLGITSVKFKAQANLIRSFMETAANPKFKHSLLHSALYRYHVLCDTTIPNPGYLPCYPASFFDIIRSVHQDTPLNVTTMTTSQWVRLLTEDGLTMEYSDGVQQYVPCRAETLAPTNNWSTTWQLVRLHGLDNELKSFNFKLLHGLLVTKKRMHQLNPASRPTCPHCQDHVDEDLKHALLDCSYNDGAGQSLLAAVQSHLPHVDPDNLLQLELGNVNDDDLLSIVTLISHCLREIWTKRLNKWRIRLYEIRATLEARCLLLRETRFSNNISLLVTLASQL